MAEYEELIEALRHCYEDDDACATCQRWLADDEWGIKCKGRLISDAAAAIEALNRLLDQNTQRCEALRKQLREAHESYERHLNELEAQLPKRGEIVRCRDCKHRPTGTGVNHDIEFPDARCPCQCYEDYWYSWMPSDDWYCGNGEKMEVQDGK